MRRAFDLAMKLGCAASALVVGVTLAWLFGVVFLKGASRLSPSFLMLPSRGDGTEGGVLYQILGTSLLVGSAALIVVPVALGLALARWRGLSGRTGEAMDGALVLLNATPSVLFGIVGYLFFVKRLQWDKSWLAGALVLATMILPTVALSTVERLRTLPPAQWEAARALGLGLGRAMVTVGVPYAAPGLLTGLLLGLSRAAGETAPILFTAAVFSGATVPQGIRDSPVLALPYHVFQLAQDTYSPLAAASAWGAAAVLVLISVGLAAVALPLRARLHEEAKS